MQITFDSNSLVDLIYWPTHCLMYKFSSSVSYCWDKANLSTEVKRRVPTLAVIEVLLYL